jgi:hypothetical protein
MSMALPVIVPNHTGFTEFCSESNSYLFSVVAGKRDKTGFAVPSKTSLISQFRRVVRESLVPAGGNSGRGVSVARAKGLAARKDMLTVWSPTAVVRQIMYRVKALMLTKSN